MEIETNFIIEISFTALLAFVILAFRLPHPLRLRLALIVISLFLGVCFWSVGSNWLAISLILIFVGGIIVIFIYVSSLSEIKKFAVGLKSKVIALPVFLLLLIKQRNYPYLPVSSFLEDLDFQLIILLTLLLLRTLFISVKISQSFKGSIVKKF